jgi:hypothetical protein
MVAAIGFLYLGARTLKTHDAMRTKVNQHVAEIERVQKLKESMVEGNAAAGELSIPKLQTELAKVLIDRGRVWYNAARGEVTDTGAVNVEVAIPDPHRIDPGMVLYVFDSAEPEAGGRYLGEFKVTFVNEQQVTLEPSRPFPAQRAAEKVERLQAAAGPWHLYEVMPPDSREAYAGKTDEQLLAILPPPPEPFENEDPDNFEKRKAEHAAMIDQYLRDGEEAKPNDPAEHVAVEVNFIQETPEAKQTAVELGLPETIVKKGAKYEFEEEIADRLVAEGIAEVVIRRFRRPLNDYAGMFQDFEVQLPLILDRIDTLRQDYEFLAGVEGDNTKPGALAEAKEQQALLEAEVALLETEHKRLLKERALVAKRRDSMQKDLRGAEANIAKLLADNKRLAAEYTALQLRAARQAEEAAASAQASVGN